MQYIYERNPKCSGCGLTMDGTDVERYPIEDWNDIYCWCTNDRCKEYMIEYFVPKVPIQRLRTV